MPTGHSYIFFLSGIHKDCDFSGHGTHFRSHRMQACSYSMRRLWIPAFLFCVPDAHSVSGYPVFSTDAVSVFSFRISFPAFPDTRIRSHLHGSLLHFLRSHLQFFLPSSMFRRFVYAHLPRDCAEPCSLWNLRIRPSVRYIRSFFHWDD